MDSLRFDAIAKTLGAAGPRRRLLAGLLGAALAGPPGQAAARGCAAGGKPCAKDRQCCSGKCQGSRCARCRHGKTACGGGCVDTATDPKHCGGCGTRCVPGQACVGGACTCDGQSGCAGCCAGNTCVTATGDDQCGANGAACLACDDGQRCLDGACACDAQSGCAGCCAGAACHVDDDDACGTGAGTCQACTSDQICRDGACEACLALQANCTDAAQCCRNLDCGPIGNLGQDQCCRPFGGACSNPGEFGECCTVVHPGGSGSSVSCGPDNTCGGPGARCTVAATCASGVCCNNGIDEVCCAAGQQCAGCQCVG